MSWQQDHEIARQILRDAERDQRRMEQEAERREQGKTEHVEGKPLPTDRHKGSAPADRARRPRRPGDYSATKDRGYFL